MDREQLEIENQKLMAKRKTSQEQTLTSVGTKLTSTPGKQRCSADYEWVCRNCGQIVEPLSYDNDGQMFYYRRTFCQCPAGQAKAKAEVDEMDTNNLQDRIRQLNEEAGLGNGLYAQYRFDQWKPAINAPHSLKALKAVKRYVETVTMDTNNWLFLYGDYGLGKTHLAIAALRAIALNNEWTARVAVWPQLCQATKESWRATHGLTESQLWGRVRSARILLLDDLDKTNTSEWAMGKLFDLINQRSTRQLPTIITANHSPKQLQSDWRNSRHEHIRDTGLAVLSRIAQCLWGGVKFEGEDQRWSV